MKIKTTYELIKEDAALRERFARINRGPRYSPTEDKKQPNNNELAAEVILRLVDVIQRRLEDDSDAA